jgi:hypothetical protein
MTLAEAAYLTGASPKWVLNTIAALGRSRRYSAALARRLTVARAIHEATGVPLVRSLRTASDLLAGHHTGPASVMTPGPDSDVALVVDLNRILSSFNIRYSVLRTSFAPRQRGRPPARRPDPLRAAFEWGLDLTLLAGNLAKTPAERLRQLDAMAAFAYRVVRRAPSSH